MKKFASILLACTLCLSQYGRFFSYIQCEIGNWIQSSDDQPCDCRQQNASPLTGDAKDLPPSKNGGLSFEEYEVPQLPKVYGIPPATSVVLTDAYQCSYAYTALSGIDHPPELA